MLGLVSGESVIYIELHVIEMASNFLAGRLFERPKGTTGISKHIET